MFELLRYQGKDGREPSRCGCIVYGIGKPMHMFSPAWTGWKTGTSVSTVPAVTALFSRDKTLQSSVVVRRELLHCLAVKLKLVSRVLSISMCQYWLMNLRKVLQAGIIL